ncbi:hypothetical protein B0H14DRAFT_3584711 [Mycena olivaceomarginata]|nr:hypothetical protein B0H14DRAFT_3584711 [Mycena olivaceomarginata]
MFTRVWLKSQMIRRPKWRTPGSKRTLSSAMVSSSGLSSTPARWVGPFINPSSMSTSLGNLHALSDALKTGECKFCKLTAAEAAKHRAKWDADVTASHVTAKHRAERSDKGALRKQVTSSNSSHRGAQDDNGEVPDALESNNNAAPPPKKCACKVREPAVPMASKAPAKASKLRKVTPPPKAPCKTRAMTNAGRVKSRVIVTSDDEQEADLHANEVDDAAGAGDVGAVAA